MYDKMTSGNVIPDQESSQVGLCDLWKKNFIQFFVESCNSLMLVMRLKLLQLYRIHMSD